MSPKSSSSMDVTMRAATIPLDYQVTEIGTLNIENSRIGTLNVESAMVAGFPQQLAAILDISGDQAALTIATDRRLEEFQAIARLQQELSRIVPSDIQFDVIYRAMAEAMHGLMDTSNMFIALNDREMDEIVFVLRYEDGRPVQRSFVDRRPRRSRRGLTEWIIEHEESLLIERDFDETTRLLGIEKFSIGTKCWLGAPMLLGDEVIGVIGLKNFEREEAYNKHHRDLLELIAGMGAVAIVNASQYDLVGNELERGLKELEAVSRFQSRVSSIKPSRNEESRAIIQQPQIKAVLEQIYTATAEELSGVMDISNMYIALYDKETDGIAFVLRYEGGKPVHSPFIGRRLRGERLGLTDWIIEHKKSLLIERDFEEATGRAGIRVFDPGTKCWLGAPMLVRWEVIGVIGLNGFEQEGTYDWHHQSLLETLANQTAIAIDNARLFSELAEAHKQAVRNTLSAMAGGYVHRLNGALGFIPASIDFIADAVTPNVREILDDIRGGVEEALAYTKRMTGLFSGSDLPREPVDINILLHSVVHRLRQPSSIKLLWDLMPVPVEIMADKMFLTEAFRNIVLNAVESMDGSQSGELRIGSKWHGNDAVKVWISDTGCGISVEHLARIFDPEFTTKSGKRGVGLWFCDTVIKVHGGHIDVDSEPGVGTTFTVFLPIN